MGLLWVTIIAVLLLGTTAAQEHVCEVSDLELDCASPVKSKKIKLSWRWNEFCKEKDALCILNEWSKTDRNGNVYNETAVIMASAGTYEMIRNPRSSAISSYTFQQCDHVQYYNRVTREPMRAKQFIGDNIKLMKNLISPRSASYKWTSPDSVCFSYFNAFLVNSNNQTIERRQFNRSTETHKWTNLHPCTEHKLVMETISLDGTVSKRTEGNFKTRVDGTFGAEAVTNLKVTNRTLDKLSIAWGEMTNGQGCIDGYKLSIMPKGGRPNKHREFKITDMQYTFQNLEACEVYTISLVGLIGDTQSHNVYVEANTEPAEVCDKCGRNRS